MNKILKNKNIILSILISILIIYPNFSFAAIGGGGYTEDEIMPQGIDSINFFNFSSSDTLIVKFKNNISYENDASTKNKDSYIFKKSDGSILKGSDISCNNIDDNGKITNSGVIGSTSTDSVAGVSSSNSVTISTFCNIPEGIYKLCVNTVQSYNNGKPLGDKMSESCTDFVSEDKILTAFPNNDSNIFVDMNFFPASVGDNVNYNVKTNYIFKDSSGVVLDGNSISCYENPTSHPNIDSSGHPTGDILNTGIIKINMGCALPIDKQYQICVSNMSDIDGDSLVGEQCVPFSETPRLISAEHIPGTRNKMRITLDNSVSNDNIGFGIKIKDSNGNILTSNNSSELSSYGNPKIVDYSDGFGGKYLYLDFARNVKYSEPTNYYNAILDPGSYQVCITGLKYNIENYSNPIAGLEKCTSLIVKDYTKPFLYSNPTGLVEDLNYYAYKNKIVIKYSEAMGYGGYGYGATNKNNYKIKDYDSNGDGVVDVTSWVSLSAATLGSLSISFSNNYNDVIINSPENGLINFIDNQTDIMIGDKDDPTNHLIKDTSGNNFIDVITYSKDSNFNNYSINENITVYKKLDLSSIRDIKSVKIKSSTEIDFKFKRIIGSVSANEFIIKNTANRNGINPISATIDPNDKYIIKFVIPSGANYEFTKNDFGDNKKNIELSTKDSVTISKDYFGYNFLEATTFNGYMNITFNNYLLEPEIKSILANKNDEIILELSGFVENDVDILKTIGDSVVITQNINNTIKNITNGGVGNDDLVCNNDDCSSYSLPNNKLYLHDAIYNELTDTSYIYGNFSGVNLRNGNFTIKTLPSGSISFVNSNGKKLKENTNGIVGSFDNLYVYSFYPEFAYDSGYNIYTTDSVGASYINVSFNKRIDKDSIIPNGLWNVFYMDHNLYSDSLISAIDGNIDCNGSYCYIQQIKNGVMFDGLANKISFPGTNIGDIIYDGNLKVGDKNLIQYSDLYVVFSSRTNSLLLFINDDVDVCIKDKDTLYYIPGNIKTLSGISVDKNYGIWNSSALNLGDNNNSE